MADLTTTLVSLGHKNDTGDPEDEYMRALHEVAAAHGIDLEAALEASVPVLPPLEPTDLTPWRDSRGEPT